MNDVDIERLLALGLTTDEIYCAIEAPGPWTLNLEEHRHETASAF